MKFNSKEGPNFGRSCVLHLSNAITRFEILERSDKRKGISESRYGSSRELKSPENQYTIPNLRQRARDGCRLCSLILRAFTKEEASLSDWLYESELFHEYISRDKLYPGASWRLHQSRQFELNFDWSLKRKIVFNDDIKTKRVTIKVVEVEKPRNLLPMVTIRSSLYDDWRTEPSRSTSSIASIDQAENWIKLCDNIHGCYKVQQTDTSLPTRLVELVKGTDKLRLCDSDKLLPDTRYATLSHCWGNIPFCRLLQENLSSFKDDIPFSILPQTFKDAVAILDKLYVKYLWIDSLCIIQDSNADWRTEAARMSKVYANSYLNLAATASRNSQEGLFRAREPLNVKGCRYVARKDRGINYCNVSFEEKRSAGWDCMNPSDWITAIVEAPLNSRAWVYQERMLAPRILHFSSLELFWECNHMRASETFPDGLPKQYIIPKQKNLLYSYSRQKKMTLCDQKREAIVRATSLGRFLDKFVYESENAPLDLWTLIVEDYSSAQLTYATDKLVAISAIAETFAHDYNDKYLGTSAGTSSESPRETSVFTKETESSSLTYLAGLWSHQLLEQLLWHVKSHHSTTILGPTPYIAPSWSWASVTSPIEYSPIREPRYNLSPLSKLLSASTIPSITPFGAVRAGSIKVLGPLFKAHLEPSKTPIRYNHYLTQLGVSSHRNDFYASLDDEASIAQSKVFCLPLFLSPWKMPSHFEIEGLLLVSTSPGIYRRLGIFSHLPMHYDTLFKEIRKAQKEGHLESEAEKIVALEELWPNVRRFVEGDGYERLEVGVFEVVIV